MAIGCTAGLTSLRLFRRSLHPAVPPPNRVGCCCTSAGVLADSPQTTERDKRYGDFAGFELVTCQWLRDNHLPMALSSHANTQRRFHRITVFADRTDYSAFPTSGPHGAPHIGSSNTSECSLNCGGSRGIYITRDPQLSS